MRVKIDKWPTHNVWPDSNGDLAVRPGLRETFDWTTDSETLYAFSVRDEFSDEVWHYTVRRNTSSGSTEIHINDEIDVTVQTLSWGDAIPPVDSISHAIVQGQVLISCPSLPTVWGYTGGRLYVAESRALEADPTLSPLAVPRGLVAEWAGRAVYYDGLSLYFSEGAGFTRTLFADNVLNPPGGMVRGLHKNASGDLVLVTVDGVWALNREAATAGEYVYGVFAHVSDYSAVHSKCSVKSRGRIWGLTDRGLRLVDTPTPHEVPLEDPDVPVTTVDPKSFSTLAHEARLYPGFEGPVVSHFDDLCVIDLVHDQHRSWWTHSDTNYALNVRGVLVDSFGRQILATKSGYAVMPIGCYDTSDGTVYGVFLGVVSLDPAESPVVREIHVSSDTGGTIVCALRGTQKTLSPPQTAPLWGTAEYDVDTYRSAPLRSRRFIFAERTDEIALEVGASGPLSRVGHSVHVEIRGVGAKHRPTG